MIHRVHPVTHKGYMLIAHAAFKGFQGRGWGECLGTYDIISRSLVVQIKDLAKYTTVKPAKLSRTKVTYLFGASIKTHFDQWSNDPKLHKGIPSELVEISAPEIRTGKDSDGDYSEIVVPDEFPPGSIMVLATDMDVSRVFLYASPTASRATQTRSCKRCLVKLDHADRRKCQWTLTPLVNQERMKRMRS